MKIRKMDATFGKLSRSSLELKDGLNIVQGDNESGKSTWCGFIRAMLYGISTREQSKSGFLADKERFRPWSGESMHGRMQVRFEGRDLAIERSSGRSGVLQSAIVTDMGTGLTLQEFDVPGESMLGIKKEVFERSAFIGQALLKVENDKSGELEKRIVSMAGSGEEDVSFSVVEKRLKSWKNRRRYNSRGEAPELEGVIEDLRVKLNSLRGDARALTMQRTKIKALREEQGVYTRQAEVWRSLRAWEKINLDQDARQELDAAQAEYQNALAQARFGDVLPTREMLEKLQRSYQQYVNDEKNYTISIENVRRAEAELSRLRGELDEFGELNRGESPDPQGDAERVRALQEQAERTKPAGGIAAGIVLGIAGAAAVLAAEYFLADVIALPQVVKIAAPAAVLTAGAVGGIMAGLGRNKKRVALQAQADEILARYGVADSRDIPGRASRWEQKLKQVELGAGNASAAQNSVERMDIARRQSAQAMLSLVRELDKDAKAEDTPGLIETVRERLEELSRLKSAAETARVRLETVKAGHNMEEFLKDSTACPPGTEKPELSEEELGVRLADIAAQLRELELDCSAMQARIGQIGDQGDLQEQIAQAREKLETTDLETRALELALSQLEAANGEMRSRFAPALEKKAGEIFEYLTGGSFSIVEIRSAQMDVFVREESAAQAREVPALSQGTVDELYLAMRLALSDLLSRDGDIPLVLDDALVNFDDARMARAVDYLKELAHSRQVILFTCQRREAEYVKNDGAVNVVKLGVCDED